MRGLTLAAFILSAVVALSSADEIEFRDCGSKATIFAVALDGCEEAPCEVERGTHVTGYAEFESDAACSELFCEIFGIIFGVEEPFPGDGCPNVNACTDMEEGDCPVEIGEFFHYAVGLDVPESAPAVPVIGKWTLKDENDDMVVCFEIDVILV